jgi:hypothetical protein
LNGHRLGSAAHAEHSQYIANAIDDRDVCSDAPRLRFCNRLCDYLLNISD